MTRIIREVTDDELLRSAKVIRDSFRTVASELGLTRENTPRHPSFSTVRQLRKNIEKGVEFFGLFLGDNQAGFVAVEKADDNLFYMERLAVLPLYRHEGFGKELVSFVFDHVRSRGGKKLSIGIIDKQTVLKDWYKGMGFRETGIRDFPHLPFRVCFMEKDLSGDA